MVVLRSDLLLGLLSYLYYHGHAFLDTVPLLPHFLLLLLPLLPPPQHNHPNANPSTYLFPKLSSSLIPDQAAKSLSKYPTNVFNTTLVAVVPAVVVVVVGVVKKASKPEYPT